VESTDKIFIAGHNGLVGSAILRQLLKKGFSNLITRSRNKLDLTSQNAVREFFKNQKPSYVIIAAAKVGGIYANNNFPAEFIYQNLMIEANIINSSYENNVKRLLFLGSSCIYPKQAKQPMKEDALLSGYLEKTNEPYAIAKISGIKLCESYNRQYGTDFRSIMPTNLYGINDNFHLNNSHVIPALIRKIHLAKNLEDNNWTAIKSDIAKNPIDRIGVDSSKEEIIKALGEFGIHFNANQCSVDVWGTGEAKREFLFVDDMALASIHVMELDRQKYSKFSSLTQSHINVGTGVDVRINELAELIRDIVEFGGELKFDKSKSDGPARKLVDVSRISKMGWKSKTNLRDGLFLTYDWYKNR
jgi:GDP-L-fucose synthase